MCVVFGVVTFIGTLSKESFISEGTFLILPSHCNSWIFSLMSTVLIPLHSDIYLNLYSVGSLPIRQYVVPLSNEVQQSLVQISNSRVS